MSKISKTKGKSLVSPANSTNIVVAEAEVSSDQTSAGIYELAEKVHNISSHPAKKKEFEKALWDLKAGLKAWADWEVKQGKGKEAV
jgi:hypothetical protein